MSDAGGLNELLFLQATPFCNINCDYCYLQDRGDRSRMSFETLRRALSFARHLGCQGKTWCLVWHVGEPLVVPIHWYREAHRICTEVLQPEPIELHFQTNATLITPEWIDFIKSDPRIQVSVSLDGPREIHDAHRRMRSGSGTHDRALRGVRLLKEAGVKFDCIAVITQVALERPDELYDFFADLGPRMLGFNAESVDGANRASSIDGPEGEARYRAFLRRIAERHLRDRAFAIRNFLWTELNLEALQRDGTLLEPVDGNRLSRPWRILSVDWKGEIHTFSPSLLGLRLPEIGPSLGNVNTRDPSALIASPALERLERQIERGMARCRADCAHFGHCGGGSPAHKWYEHGTFDVSETANCRLGVQADWEEYIAAAECLVLERELA